MCLPAARAARVADDAAGRRDARVLHSTTDRGTQPAAATLCRPAVARSVTRGNRPGDGARTSAATEPSLATEATCQPSGSQATQAPIAACSLHPAQRGL